MGALLRVEGVAKAFGGAQAVRHASFHVDAGEVLGLVGENGAGKSTVVRMLAGVVAPDAGRIVVGGQAVRLASPHDSARHGISVIHQELELIGSQSIAENLFLGRPRPRRAGALDWRALRARANAAFEAFGHPLDVDQLVADSTVWERWATALVRALMVRSRLLVLDEPTAAMDDAGAAQVHAAIRRAAADGAAVILVSHRLHEVEALCDRVHAMRNGQSVGEMPRAELRRDHLVRLIAGDAPVTVRRTASAPRPDATPVLAVERLTLPHRLHGVSLSVRAGEIVGLAGLVGSGRSSLLRAIAGAEPGLSGELRLDGRPYVPRSPRAAARASVAFVAEDRLSQGLLPILNIAHNIDLGARPAGARRGPLVRHAQLYARAERWIQRLGIASALPGGSVLHLSGGNQQKVLVARALDRRPRVLLLDEPTRGVDVGARAELGAVIRQLGEQGIAVLVALSDLEELAELVDRAVVLRDGRVAGQLAAADLTRQRILEVCYGSG